MTRCEAQSIEVSLSGHPLTGSTSRQRVNPLWPLALHAKRSPEGDEDFDSAIIDLIHAQYKGSLGFFVVGPPHTGST